jgi:hypothetical protein
MKQPEKYFCDMCGKEVSNKNKHNIHVRTYCNWTDGIPEGPYTEIVSMDLCDDCLLKSCNIETGFQGSNPKFIRE